MQRSASSLQSHNDAHTRSTAAFVAPTINTNTVTPNFTISYPQSQLSSPYGAAISSHSARSLPPTSHSTKPPSSSPCAQLQNELSSFISILQLAIVPDTRTQWMEQNIQRGMVWAERMMQLALQVILDSEIQLIQQQLNSLIASNLFPAKFTMTMEDLKVAPIFLLKYLVRHPSLSVPSLALIIELFEKHTPENWRSEIVQSVESSIRTYWSHYMIQQTVQYNQSNVASQQIPRAVSRSLRKRIQDDILSILASLGSENGQSCLSSASPLKPKAGFTSGLSSIDERVFEQSSLINTILTGVQANRENADVLCWLLICYYDSEIPSEVALNMYVYKMISVVKVSLFANASSQLLTYLSMIDLSFAHAYFDHLMLELRRMIRGVSRVDSMTLNLTDPRSLDLQLRFRSLIHDSFPNKWISYPISDTSTINQSNHLTFSANKDLDILEATAILNSSSSSFPFVVNVKEMARMQLRRAYQVEQIHELPYKHPISIWFQEFILL